MNFGPVFVNEVYHSTMSDSTEDSIVLFRINLHVCFVEFLAVVDRHDQVEYRPTGIGLALALMIKYIRLFMQGDLPSTSA